MSTEEDYGWGDLGHHWDKPYGRDVDDPIPFSDTFAYDVRVAEERERLSRFTDVHLLALYARYEKLVTRHLWEMVCSAEAAASLVRGEQASTMLDTQSNSLQSSHFEALADVIEERGLEPYNVHTYSNTGWDSVR